MRNPLGVQEVFVTNEAACSRCGTPSSRGCDCGTPARNRRKSRRKRKGIQFPIGAGPVHGPSQRAHNSGTSASDLVLPIPTLNALTAPDPNPEGLELPLPALVAPVRPRPTTNRADSAYRGDDPLPLPGT